RSLHGAQQRRQICRTEGGRCHLPVGQARSLPRPAARGARAVQGSGLRAVLRVGKADPLTAVWTIGARTSAPPGANRSAATDRSDKLGNQLGLKVYLTLRFSADVLPRFSTSSY